jgi:1,4-dihydroxy-2-naphthoate octaprenyltransferase
LDKRSALLAADDAGYANLVCNGSEIGSIKETIEMAKLLQLARPQFLISSVALFTMGASWAIILGSPFSLLRALLGYLIILPAHLSVSFSNDYFDVEADKHANPSLFSGGSGILVEQPQLRKPALWIAITLNLCSVSIGILFLLKYSYSIWFLAYVVASNIIGWIYSAPPFKLVYRGYGELLTAFTSGCIVPGMGLLVVSGNVNSEGLLFMIPLTLYGLVFILSVEIPDMEADRLGDKKTWVAQKGRRFGFTAIRLLLLIATGYFFLIPYMYSRILYLDFRLLGMFSLVPLALGFLGLVKRPTDRQTALKLVNTLIGSLAVFFILTDIVMVIAAASKVSA